MDQGYNRSPYFICFGSTFSSLGYNNRTVDIFRTFHLKSFVYRITHMNLVILLPDNFSVDKEKSSWLISPPVEVGARAKSLQPFPLLWKI